MEIKIVSECLKSNATLIYMNADAKQRGLFGKKKSYKPNNSHPTFTLSVGTAERKATKQCEFSPFKLIENGPDAKNRASPVTIVGYKPDGDFVFAFTDLLRNFVHAG